MPYWARPRSLQRPYPGLARNPTERIVRDRRTAYRPIRQDVAARGGPPGRGRGTRRHRAVRRAGTRPGARTYLPGHTPGTVERARRRARRRAGRRRAGAVLALRGAPAAAGRRGGHDEPLRAAAAGQVPGARPGAGLLGP